MDVESTIDSDMELLGEEPELEIDLDANEEVPNEEEESSEDKEKVEEEKEEPEIDKPIYDRPSIKEIKTKYPTIFKDFPAVKTALFRENEYTKIFPTVEDARNAATETSAYEELSNSVLGGDAGHFINALDKSGETSNFTVRYLDKLQESNPDLHFKVIAPYLDRAAKAFYQFGVQQNSEDVKMSAENFAQFLFNDANFAKDKEFQAIKPKEENKELKSEREKFQNERFNEFKNTTLNSLGSKLAAEIDKGLPKGIKDSVRKAIHREVIDHLEETLSKDAAYMQSMGDLWRKADGSEAARSRIINAYLARAKNPMSAKRREAVVSFLGGSKESNDELRQTVNVNSSRREGNSPSRVGNGQKVSSKDINWSKTSDLDFLNDKITLRKK